MKNLYYVTLKRSYADPQKIAVAATNSDQAIERARIANWKNFKYYKKSDWDVIELVKSDTKVAV